MTEPSPERLESQRLALQQHLQVLDGDRLSAMLPQARLDVLSFVASGAAMARRVLAIEQATRLLLERLQSDDPLVLQDAATVRDSSVRAVEQGGQVLALVCDWVMNPPPDPGGVESAIRAPLHALNNVLIGITCYAGLLSDGAPPGDPGRDALVLIRQEGAAISRLVRERAGLQGRLNSLLQGRSEDAPELEQQILGMLLRTLGLELLMNPAGGLTLPEPEAVSLVLETLPPAEAQVMGEALRRLSALG